MHTAFEILKDDIKPQKIFQNIPTKYFDVRVK